MTTTNIIPHKRKEYIDLAKGICIIFVMSEHIAHNTILSSPYITSFRMPFYFFICGLFISTKYSYKHFAIKKVNALLIPFLFFSLIALFNDIILSIFNISNITISNIFRTIISPYTCINGPLWFLICLFWGYMMFYFLEKKIHKSHIRSLLIFSISIIGFYMSKFSLFGHHIILPFFFSSAMTSLIFIYLGFIFRKKLNLLDETPKDKYYFIIALSIFILTQYTMGPNYIEMIWNKYTQSYIITIISGVSGSLSIIYLCKFIKKVPIISYIGRYSLIALATHSIFIQYLKIYNTNPNITLLTLIIILCPAIYYIKKYFPKFCAQEPYFNL